MNRSHLLPTIIAAVIGIASVLVVLFAWHLPPFGSAKPFTENAYVRGRVTTIAPQLSGYISEVLVKDFDKVESGQVIARIDDKIFRHKLAQAEAGLASAEASLSIAEQGVISARAVETSYEASLVAARASLEVAKSKSDRAHTLSERGVTALSDLDGIDLDLRRNEAQVQQAEANLAMQREAINSALSQISARQADIDKARAAVELARIDLESTEIRAPEAGRLGQVAARVGQYVTPGTALVSHIGTGVWVIANFKETEIGDLRTGAAVSFTVDALGGQRFTGKVEGFSPATASEFSVLASSNATGNFTKVAQRLPLRIAVDEGQAGIEMLVPGLSVQVRAE